MPTIYPPKKKSKSSGSKKSSSSSSSSNKRRKKNDGSSSSSSSSKRKSKSKKVQQKNPAEFFAENQNIAGFDNPGKALYTTIRELVENSLDAAESIQVLPSIQIEVTELSQKTFDALRGNEKQERQNLSLYNKAIQEDAANDNNNNINTNIISISSSSDIDNGSTNKRKRNESEDSIASAMSQSQNDNNIDLTQEDSLPSMSQDVELSQSQTNVVTNGANNKKGVAGGKKKGKKTKRKSINRVGFFKIVCRDNGMGMETKKVSEFLGRVLSGSNYGVKQTRGKFGLGAKMALIWSKKSTGLPIEIRTAHGIDGGSIPGETTSQTKLDINIYKNEPKIISQEITENTEKWRGTEFTVVLEGNWMWAKSKIQQYLSALAVVTPFADFTLSFDSDKTSKPFTLKYERRSERIPPPAKTIKHHPTSVNQLIVQKLLHNFSQGKYLWQFLSSEFQVISPALAKKLVVELKFDPKIRVSEVTNDTQLVHNITKILKEAKFNKPSGNCLSPAGEYNLKLGIMKEYIPDHVATGRTNVCVFEGHPFIVEAGVSIGGKEQKEGIHVYRFANRIPLLFEGHSDVATRVAKNNITWSSYHIKKNIDKIGVFVSIVSTKIPFKGTGKEFISAANKEYYNAVTTAIRKCCNQLKQTLKSRKSNRAKAERLKNMARFIPSVCKSIVHVLNGIIDRQEKGDVHLDRIENGGDGGSSSGSSSTTDVKTLEDNRLNLQPKILKLLQMVKKGKVTQTKLEEKLTESVQQFDEGELAKIVQKGKILEDDRVNCFLLPINTMDASNFAFDMQHNALNRPNVVFRLLRGLMPNEENNLPEPIVPSRITFVEGEEEEEEEEEEENKSNIMQIDDDDDEDLSRRSEDEEVLKNSGDEDDDDEPIIIKTKKPAARRGSSRKAALNAKKKINKIMESSSDDDDDDESGSDKSSSSSSDESESDDDVVDLT